MYEEIYFDYDSEEVNQFQLVVLGLARRYAEKCKDAKVSAILDAEQALVRDIMTYADVLLKRTLKRVEIEKKKGIV